MKKQIVLSLLLACGDLSAFEVPETILGENSEEPLCVIDEYGMKSAIWMHFDGVHEIIQSAIFDRGWSVHNLSPSGFHANVPHIAARNGRAVAVWQLNRGKNYVIQASVYSKGKWSEARQISTPGINAYEPKVTINSTGVAMAVWSESGDPYDIVKVALFSGEWQTPHHLSNPQKESYGADISLNDEGEALAVWKVVDLESNCFVITGINFVNGSWKEHQELSFAPTNVTDLTVSMTPYKSGVAFWQNDSLDSCDLTESVNFNGFSWDIP